MFQRLLTGEMCCYDLSGPDQWKSGPDEMKKKCCNNPSGSPVIRPQYIMGQRQLEKVNSFVNINSLEIGNFFS